MSYPVQFIRGIAREEWIDDGRLAAASFQFIEIPREDDYLELSINWYDDEGALTEILLKKKGNDDLYFRMGAAIFCRKELDRHMKTKLCENRLNYERSPIDDNPYHGNILILKGLNKTQKNMLYGAIAMCMDKIIHAGSPA